MQLVLLTAIGVGGATVIGAIAGFLIKDISHRVSDLVLAYAAGVQLAELKNLSRMVVLKPGFAAS